MSSAAKSESSGARGPVGEPPRPSSNRAPDTTAAQDQEWFSTISWIIDRLYSGGSWMAMERDRPEINDAMKRLREVVARHAPSDPAACFYDGAYWVECDKDAPGAFPVWRCE